MLNNLEYFRLAIKISSYASERGFFTNIDEKKSIITFSPLYMNYNIYLEVLFEIKNKKLVFKIKNHKFLKNEEIKNKYLNKEVPLLWIKNFLDFRENMAKHETARCIEFEKQKNKRIQNEYKLAEESIEKSMAYEKDEYDWESSDWEDYMGGPDY